MVRRGRCGGGTESNLNSFKLDLFSLHSSTLIPVDLVPGPGVAHISSYGSRPALLFLRGSWRPLKPTLVPCRTAGRRRLFDRTRRTQTPKGRRRPTVCHSSINLVDPASSHTLVSKIKPCMSKYKHFCTVKLRMAHYISYSLLDSTLLLGYP